LREYEESLTELAQHLKQRAATIAAEEADVSKRETEYQQNRVKINRRVGGQSSYNDYFNT
jgi:xanthine dehydrogenase molybdopterin-binding subunit B